MRKKMVNKILEQKYTQMIIQILKKDFGLVQKFKSFIIF